MQNKVAFGILMVVIFLVIGSVNVIGDTDIQSDFISEGLKDYASHEVIRIDGDDDFTSENGVVSGSGTESDPYIISYWIINAYDAPAAIYIGNTTKYFKIDHCLVDGADLNPFFSYGSGGGIILYHVTNGIISYTSSYNNELYGIYLISSSNIQIVHSDIHSNPNSGVYLSSSTNVEVSYSEFHDNPTDIRLSSSSNNKFTHNEFYSEHDTSFDLSSSDNNEISNNTIENVTGDAIYISGSKYNYIGYNTITNASAGMEIRESIYQNTISHNTFEDCEYGIYMYVTRHALITQNNFKNNSEGDLYLKESTDNTISHNSFTFNSSSYDILLESNSDRNLISWNEFNLDVDDDGMYGIGVNSSDYVRIENNTLHNLFYEITINSSSYVTVAYNNISHGIYGILLTDEISHLNVVYNEFYRLSGYHGIFNPIGGAIDTWGYVEDIDNSTFSHNYIKEVLRGIDLMQTDNVSVEYNQIYDAGYSFLPADNIGVKLDGKHFSVVGNYFSNADLVLWGDYGFIYKNTLLNGSIYLDHGVYNKVYENEIHRGGIVMEYRSKEGWITQDIPTNNTVNGKPVYYYKNIDMENMDYITDGGQIILANVTHGTIDLLRLDNVERFVQIGYSNGIWVMRSNFSYGVRGPAIYVYESLNVYFYHDEIYHGESTGIYIEDSTSVSIGFGLYDGNEITYNGGYGIHIMDSHHILIKNNRIVGNSLDGIFMDKFGASTYDITIFSNNISANHEYGIYIYSGITNVEIYNNTFYYNHGSGDTFDSSTLQAYDDGSNNIWYKDGKGNYWHDLAGTYGDSDGDGILDDNGNPVSYPIDGSAGSKDLYPLAEPVVIPEFNAMPGVFVILLGIAIYLRKKF